MGSSQGVKNHLTRSVIVQISAQSDLVESTVRAAKMNVTNTEKTTIYISKV